MYLIRNNGQNGQFVAGIDPVSGTPRWTTDIRMARSWKDYATAREMAEGIGYVWYNDPIW